MLLSSHDEHTWSHVSVSCSTVHFGVFVMGLMCFLIGLAQASSEIIIPYDNFGPGPLFNATRDKLVSGHFPTFSEATAALNEFHPLHNLYKNHRVQYRYEFGNVFYNFCALWPVPKGAYLPSLLRVMEMRVDTQTWTRSAILIALGIKFAMCLTRSHLIIRNSEKNNLVQILCLLSPLLEVLQMSLSFLITCLHQTADKPLFWLSLRVVPWFALCFLASAIVYTFLEVFDKTVKTSRVLRLRMLCILAFACTITYVIENRNKLIKIRICHQYIPAREAIMEYVCIASIIIYSFSQIYDHTNMIAILSCEYEETTDDYDEDFRPAFIYSKSLDFSSTLLQDTTPSLPSPQADGKEHWLKLEIS